jgi:hypothetical protein
VRFVVNVICEDFVWFVLIFHLLNHSCRRSRCCWSLCDANAGSLSIARRAVSSANAVVNCGVFCRCTVYSKYNNGPNALPWGTPKLTVESFRWY